jgi:hypothetical protein
VARPLRPHGAARADRLSHPPGRRGDIRLPPGGPQRRPGGLQRRPQRARDRHGRVHHRARRRHLPGVRGRRPPRRDRRRHGGGGLRHPRRRPRARHPRHRQRRPGRRPVGGARLDAGRRGRRAAGGPRRLPGRRHLQRRLDRGPGPQAGLARRDAGQERGDHPGPAGRLRQGGPGRRADRLRHRQRRLPARLERQAAPLHGAPRDDPHGGPPLGDRGRGRAARLGGPARHNSRAPLSASAPYLPA